MKACPHWSSLLAGTSQPLVHSRWGNSRKGQKCESQTVGKRDYIVRRSFFRIIDLCMDTIRPIQSSCISRTFDGKSCTIVCRIGQDDTVIIGGWRSLQLDIHVRCLSFILSPSACLIVLVTYLQTLPQSDKSVHTIQDALTLIS